MGLNRFLRNTVIFGGRSGRRAIAMEWSRALWSAGLWRGNKWLGVEIWQWPTDLFVLQEILFEQRPRVVLETGTASGGSAIFYSSMLHLLGGGRVVSVDLEGPEEVRRLMAEHPRGGDVTLIRGDSKAPETLDKVRESLGDETNVLVVLDSNHSYEHVLGELRAYRDFVPVGGSLVVFDTICHYIADLPGKGSWRDDNPLRAVDEFLAEDTRFERDPGREKLQVTMAPGGYLRRAR
jgi:cephalosporin hydroxylase